MVNPLGEVTEEVQVLLKLSNRTHDLSGTAFFCNCDTVDLISFEYNDISESHETPHTYLDQGRYLTFCYYSDTKIQETTTKTLLSWSDMPEHFMVMNPTEKPTQVGGGLRLDLAGTVVEVRVEPGSSRPPRLIEIDEQNLAKHEAPVSRIEVLPSLVDPKVIIVRWPFQKGLTYALFILDQDGQPLFQSPPSPVGSQIIPIASIEAYIGKNVRAIVVWFEHESGKKGVLPDKWFQTPKPAAPFVWNFEEEEQKWVRRHKRRKLFNWWQAELLLLAFLFISVLLGAYYMAYKMPNYVIPKFHF